MSPFLIDFELRKNGRMKIGMLEMNQSGHRLPALRSNIQKLPNMSLTMTIDQVDLSHHVYLSGELGSRLFQHPLREILWIFKNVRPNVKEFARIEDLILGRQKGPDNHRRLGRAKAFLRQKLPQSFGGEERKSERPGPVRPVEDLVLRRCTDGADDASDRLLEVFEGSIGRLDFQSIVSR
jgi:hypothetical protein